jgi:predicted ATP-binding protein involved in virulence
VLDAATIVLGPFVGAFDLGKSKAIEHKDARYHRLPEQSDSEQVFPVQLEAQLAGLEQHVVRELNGAKGRTTIKDAAELANRGKALMDSVRSLEPVPLPLLAYYGSGRLWNAHKNMGRKSVLSASRTMGYEDCFSSASSFTQVQQWMTKATYAVLQQQGMDAYQGYTLADQLKGIQNTVDYVLGNEGWSGFHYSMQHEELAMTHTDLGVLPVSMLSDGVRAMVSLVADMAWRCAKLNPQMGADAQQKTEGIVFIDEVDMHLHPEWQQTVIKALRAAFPKVQFVVTTHSPQVLSTVPAQCIRVLSQNEVITPSSQTEGVASSSVLAEVMGTDPVPDIEVARQLSAYQALIQQDLDASADAQHLRSVLEHHYGANHPLLLECDRLIRLQVLKRLKPPRSGTKDR